MTLEEKTEQVLRTLRKVSTDFAPTTFANSLGAEDMVLTDLILKFVPGIEIFTLDTGRLNLETYDLLSKVHAKYKHRILVYFPDTSQVEEFVNQHGLNAFYDGVGLRKTCCNIRKVAPLRRALKGKASWITGRRQEQSPSREELPLFDWDNDNNLHKVNPLTDWTNDETWEYIHQNGVPYNPLHNEGYPSIGCAPCTRPIGEGEEIRAGRWWWEDDQAKECGLHPTRKVV